jgi:hypothetical protein
MTGDEVTWGADFWQRVLISGLGTLGSAGLAIGLYVLKRWHDRKDALHEEVRTVVRECLNAGRDRPTGEASDFGTTVALFGTRFAELASRIDERPLKQYCGAMSEALMNGPPGSLRPGAEQRSWFVLLSTYSLKELLAHFEGKTMDLTKLREEYVVAQVHEARRRTT